MSKKILITGVKGQIGTYLLPSLSNKYGKGNIIATDISDKYDTNYAKYLKLDVTNRNHLKEVINEEKITNVIHLASILSSLAEKYHDLARKVNVDSVLNLFELATESNFSLFIPSTIAVYGNDASKTGVGLSTKTTPSSFYGVSKVLMENLGTYYKLKHSIDFRSIRYIGVVSPFEYAYNGSTDYASEIFFKAKRKEEYDICLSNHRILPMAYIDDIINGTIDLLDAPKEKITEGVYNINSCSFSVDQMVKLIKIKYPDFKYKIKPDLRDQISSTWPYNYDDSKARSDWNWRPKYDSLEKIFDVMDENVKV